MGPTASAIGLSRLAGHSIGLASGISLHPHALGGRFYWVDLDVDPGTTASAGPGAALMDEPKGLKEFALTADWIARGVLYFLLFAAKCFLTSAFLNKHYGFSLSFVACLEGCRLERSEES